MAQDPAMDGSPLRRRRAGTATTEPPVPADAETTALVDEEFLGRPAPRRRISRRYLATVGAGALIVATIVGLAAAYATAKGPHRYQSLALVEIDQPRAIAVSADDGVVAKLSRLRYKYAGLMRTETFDAPVAQKLGLSVGQVAGSVYAAVDPSSFLIGVGARSSKPLEAQRIAAGAAQGLIDFATKQQVDDRIPAPERVTFTLVSPARPGVKISPTHSRIVLVGLGTFVFIVAGTLAFGFLWRRDY